MSAPADLAEFRLLRALRGGQPGAFPTLWNAHAGAAWSVVRAMCASDREAIGWMTSFRVDLAERATDLSMDAPLAAQVGVALYQHLRGGFRRGSELPASPLPPDEDGVRRIPESERLLYLVDLFFDASADVLAGVAGRDAQKRIDAVRRLLEPTNDTDSRFLVHTTLLRTPPAEVLILPPGAEPPPPKPRWWPWIVGGAALLVATGVALWVRPPARSEDVGALHAAAVDAPTLRDADPVRMGLELARMGLPAVLAEAPDLSGLGLNLFAVRVEDGGAPVVVLAYTRANRFWTLQHHLRLPDLNGAVLATRATPLGVLEAREVTPNAVSVAWEESASAWVLTADAPPQTVLEVADAIREARHGSGIPFLGAEQPVPADGHSD